MATTSQATSKHSTSVTVKTVDGDAERATLGNPQVTDADGLLVDVDVQMVDDNPSTTREDKRQDVDHFFHPVIIKDVNGRPKKYRTCKPCP